MIDADGEGRLLRAVFGPSTWRRSYGDRYIEIVSEAVQGERFHVPRRVDTEEANALFARACALVDEVMEAARVEAPEACEAMQRILAWDVSRLRDDGERFRAIYPVLGPLPPDQQTALVLRVQPHFEAHVRAVLAFLGRACPMRQGVYLDGVDDAASLEPALAVVRRLAPEAAATTAAALTRAAEGLWGGGHGLTRVYLPLEAPAPEVLAPLHETGAAVSLVAPAPWSDEEADTLAERVNGLDLHASDTLYTLEPQPYPYDLSQRLRLRSAFHRFKKAVRFPDPPTGPVVTHFPIVQSVY